MPLPDRRVRRTRAALATALLALAAERPFDDLTIRDLTDRADVGYATFFRHYPNKEALLLDVLGGIVDELAERLQPIADAGQLADAGRELFEFVAANAERMKVLLSARHGRTVEGELRAAVAARVLASPGFHPPTEVPPELAAHHLAVASLALVAWWLDHGVPGDPAHMGAIYARLVVAPTRGA